MTYRARWPIELGDLSSSVFQEKKEREKMEIKAITTTWSTKSKTPSRSQFVTDKKHCVAGRLMLFWRRVFIDKRHYNIARVLSLYKSYTFRLFFLSTKYPNSTAMMKNVLAFLEFSFSTQTNSQSGEDVSQIIRTWIFEKSAVKIPCYQRSLTTRQKWEKGESLPFLSFLPRRERPLIAGNRKDWQSAGKRPQIGLCREISNSYKVSSVF